MKTARIEQQWQPGPEDSAGRERGVRGGDCLLELPDEVVEVVLAFRTDGQHAGLEGQRRVGLVSFSFSPRCPTGRAAPWLRHIWHLHAVGLLDRPWLG